MLTIDLALLLLAAVWGGTSAFSSPWSAPGPATWRSKATPCCNFSDHYHIGGSDDRHYRAGKRRRFRRTCPGIFGGDARSLRHWGSACRRLSSSSSSSPSSSVEGVLVEERGFPANTLPISTGRVEPLGAPAAAAVAGERQHQFVAERNDNIDAMDDRPEGSSVKHSSGLMFSARQLSAFGIVAALVAVAFDYEHGMAGFHWFAHWAGGAMPHFPPRDAGDGGLGQVHLTPAKSAATGLGAGFTRAMSRTLTFPLDTVKTRSQLSRLGANDRARLPEGMRRLIDGRASFKGVFKGFSAFLVQAGPSNAAFFVVYDALNAIGTATLLGGVSAGAVGPHSSVFPTALHLGASSIATVPTNLVRTPAEVVKQRLQVGQEDGNALQALFSIIRTEGVRGLFVGAKEQLIREVPFNAIQFAAYECLTSYLGGSELWADATFGAVSSAFAAVITHPVDTVKTRVMTKSVPGYFGDLSPGFFVSASLVAEEEGLSSLYLGLLPRVVLVSTGGAFYFWGQEFASQLMGRAGF